MAEPRSENARPISGTRARRLLCFCLAGLLVLDAAVVWYRDAWLAYMPSDYAEKVAACAAAAHDAVIVGGSTVGEGVDPRLLEGLVWRGEPLRSPYNLGLGGATASDVWHAVEHGLVVPPRLLVYGITASDWNESRHEPGGPRVLMSWEDLLVWVRSRPAAWEFTTRHFVQGRASRLWSLFHYRNGIRLWSAARLDEQWPELLPTAAAAARERFAYGRALARERDGFAPRPGAAGRLADMKAIGAVPDRFIYFEKYRVDPAGHVAYTERLLEWARQRGVDVVLVDMPVSVELEQMYPAAFADYRRSLADLLARHPAVRLLDGSSAHLGIGDRELADLVHLNAAGVARFGAWLRAALEEQT